jgi:hypothetical protein
MTRARRKRDGVLGYFLAARRLTVERGGAPVAKTWLAVLAGAATLAALFGLVVLGGRKAPAWQVALAFAAAATAFATLFFELLG